MWTCASIISGICASLVPVDAVVLVDDQELDNQPSWQRLTRANREAACCARVDPEKGSWIAKWGQQDGAFGRSRWIVDLQ